MLTRIGKYLLLMLLPLAAMMIVACDSTEEEGGGGLTEGTPMGTEQVPDLPTAEVEVTSTEEITETAEVTETVEVTETATVEPAEETTEETPSAESTTEPSEDMTEEAPTTVSEATVVMLASELIDMSIQDDAGTEIGSVAEVLVDGTGAIQYVVVYMLPDLAPEVGESAYPDPTDTTQPTQTESIVNQITVAVPWDSFEVEAEAAAQEETTGTEESMETEEITGTEEITETDTEEESAEVNLIYAGDTPLEEQPSFEIETLDEEGYVLDDQGASDVNVPAEYIDLLQVSDYGDYEVLSGDDEELGNGDDLLVNLTEGQIVYLVVDVGGFLGIGAKSVFIPWDSLQLEVTVDGETETEAFRLDTTEEMLNEAPDAELGDWTPLVEPGWDAEFRDYWQSGGTTG